MDNSFQRQGPDDSDMQQQPRGILVNSLHIFESILQWLSGLIQLTEDEQRDAGICLDRLGGEYSEVGSFSHKENI